MKAVEGIVLQDRNGNTMSVTGFEAEDGVHVAACGLMEMGKQKWKTNSGGGTTALTAMGVMGIYAKKADGTLVPSIVSSQVIVLQSATIENGQTTYRPAFLREIRDQDVHSGREGETPAKFATFIPASIQDAMDAAINWAGNHTFTWQPGQVNAKIADGIKALTALGAKHSAKATTVTPAAQSTENATAAATFTADDIIPPNAK